MPAQFGSQKIVEMRYGGQNVTEAMYGGQIVFQRKKPFSYDFGFQDLRNIWWAPLSRFDKRTHASAPRVPAWTYNGMLVAPDSGYPAHLGHLLNRQCDGDITFVVTIGDTTNTLSYPSSIIIKSNLDQTQKIVAEFGSDGVSINMVMGDGFVNLVRYYRAMGPGQRLEFSLVNGILSSKHENYLMGTLSLAAYDTTDWSYFGFGVFSTSNQWSTRIDRIQITGVTSFDEGPYASASARRLTVARDSWTEIAAVLNNTSYTYIIQGECSWSSNSTSNRQLRLLVGGAVVAVGSSFSVYAGNYPVGPDQWVILQALSSSSTTSQRAISDGSLLMVPPIT